MSAVSVGKEDNGNDTTTFLFNQKVGACIDCDTNHVQMMCAHMLQVPIPSYLTALVVGALESRLALRTNQ